MEKLDLAGKRILVTAGATKEPIDPFRYIANNTNGHFGYELADACLSKGASVFLVSGPSRMDLKHPRLTTVNVNTACEMYLACCQYFEESAIVFFAAEVSDYRPKQMLPFKIRSEEPFIAIKMVKNIDIAAAFARVKKPGQLTIGFAAENLPDVTGTLRKMEAKNLDMMVVSTMHTEEFTCDAAIKQVTLVRRAGRVVPLAEKTKTQVVARVLEATGELLNEPKKLPRSKGRISGDSLLA